MCLRTLLVLEGVQTDLDRVRALRARAPPLFLLLRSDESGTDISRPTDRPKEFFSNMVVKWIIWIYYSDTNTDTGYHIGYRIRIQFVRYPSDTGYPIGYNRNIRINIRSKKK
jgi:hypothetical protein